MPLADSVKVWIGSVADVERALNQVHADLDKERVFILDVPCGNIAFLHSAKEVLVTSAMAYLMKGKRMSLYMLMFGRAPSSTPEIKFGEDQ